MSFTQPFFVASNAGGAGASCRTECNAAASTCMQNLVARRTAHAYFYVARIILRLLLGPKCALRPLPKMRADRGRVGSVEKRWIGEDGQGEKFQDSPAVEVVEGVFHAETQTSKEFGPIVFA